MLLWFLRYIRLIIWLSGRGIQELLDIFIFIKLCFNYLLNELEKNEYVYLVDFRSIKIVGRGKVFFKFFFGKLLFLFNVFYVFFMRRNFVSRLFFIKAGFKLIFDADKVIVIRNGEFVGKGFCNEGLFIFDVSCERNESVFFYLLCLFDVWYGRLGYVNVVFIKRFKNYKLIFKIFINDMDKLEVCVEVKYFRKVFNFYIKAEISLLELVYTDFDFRNIISRGGKNYYIMFVDDYFRYIKLYLLI